MWPATEAGGCNLPSPANPVEGTRCLLQTYNQSKQPLISVLPRFKHHTQHTAQRTACSRVHRDYSCEASRHEMQSNVVCIPQQQLKSQLKSSLWHIKALIWCLRVFLEVVCQKKKMHTGKYRKLKRGPERYRKSQVAVSQHGSHLYSGQVCVGTVSPWTNIPLMWNCSLYGKHCDDVCAFLNCR